MCIRDSLGARGPEYAHVGLVVNSEGRRLAKRDGAVTLGRLEAAGTDAGRVFRLLSDSCGLPPAESPRALLAQLLDAGDGGAGPLHDGALARPWTPPPSVVG